MQYDHGKRVTPHFHELSALDRAICEFEQKATHYYTKKASCSLNESPEQRAERERDLAGALAHLKFERLRAVTQIQVQCRLQEYRKAASTAAEGDFEEQIDAQDILLAEKHHPTDKLANFMRMDGRPQPSPRFTPHHLVQGKGKRDDAYLARIELHAAGIGINDPDNGVWMPRTRKDKGHWAYPSAAAHSELHTLNYEKWVYQSISFKSGETSMRAALLLLRTHLKNGTQPVQVTQKPAPHWNGT